MDDVPKPTPTIGALLRAQMRNIAPFLTLIFLTGFFAAASPSFATLDNVGNILTQVSVTGIIAVGLTFVILCAEIDLSIASIANVTGIAVAYFTQQESYVNIANIPMPGWAAILLALSLCALLGLVNAFGLTVIGIPSFIMTRAMMQIAAGISALLVRGQIAYKVPGLVATLGSQSVAGVPWIVIVSPLMLLGVHLVLTYTRFGRYVYMVGGNREAAEYSGLNVNLILGSVMVIGAVCAGIGRMLRRPQQRARSRQYRQLPEDIDPRHYSTRGARHQRLCAEVTRQGGRIAVRYRAKSGCQSRISRAALVTAPMVRNDGVSNIITRARRRLRASQIARSFVSSIHSKSILWASPRMRRIIFAAEKLTVSWNRRSI